MRILTQRQSTKEFTPSKAAVYRTEYSEQDIPHLTAWELRDHLITTTVALADELTAARDPDRLAALRELYTLTLAALQQRGWTGR